jgi:hypothetical protein
MKRLVDIVLNLVGITPDRPAAQVEIEHESKVLSRAVCCRCRYWSGLNGDEHYHLMCGVNVPQPTEYELHGVSCVLAYAYHDCPDFERKG